MAFKIGSKQAQYTITGTPYMWNSGDVTTGLTNESKLSVGGVSDNKAGTSVAVGFNTIVVGVPFTSSTQGEILIYDLDGTVIATKTATTTEYMGFSVSIGDGRIVTGGYAFGTFQGRIRIFDMDGDNENAVNGPGGSGTSFGFSTAIGDGRIVVGAPSDDAFNTNGGAVYLYDIDGNLLSNIVTNGRFGPSWTPVNFGRSVAIGQGRIVVGDNAFNSFTGRVGVFNLSGEELFYIDASDGQTNDQFGYSVAIGSDRIAVGAISDDDVITSAGAVYLYDINGNFIKKLTTDDAGSTPSSGSFGYSVAIGSGRIVIGAEGQAQTGAVYIYDLDGNWIDTETANDAAQGDAFGTSVAIGSGKVVVGGPGNDDAGSNSGSAYVYDTPSVYTLYDAIDLQRGYK